MPINRLLQNSKLEPAEREVLNLAFIRALRLLHLVDRNDPVCEIVARKVIEIGATGAGDPVVISEIAVRKLIDAYGGGSTEVLVPKPAQSSDTPAGGVSRYSLGRVTVWTGDDAFLGFAATHLAVGK